MTISRIAGVELRVDDGAWMDTDPVDGAFDGFEESFSGVLPVPVDGEYTVEARSRNTEGNVDVTLASGFITVSGSLCSAVDALPRYVNRSAFEVKARASDRAAAVELWHRPGTEPFALHSTDSTAPWGWTIDAALSGGDAPHAFYSVAIDADGNREPSPSEPDATTTVDTTKPTSAVDPIPSLVTTDFTLAVAASDPSGVTSVALWYRTDVVEARYAIDGSPPWSFDVAVTALPGDGSYRFYSLAEDAAGNVEDPAFSPGAATTVDTRPPTLAIISPAPASWSKVRLVTVAWTAADAGTGIGSYEVALDGGAVEDVGTATSRSFDGLSDGGHRVAVRVLDGAGRDASAEVRFSVDTTAPSVAITAPAPGEVVLERILWVAWTSTDEGSGVEWVEVLLDDGSFVPASGTNHTFSGIVDGDHAVTVRVGDVAGNVQERTVTFRVHADVWTGGGPLGWIPMGSLVAGIAGGALGAGLWTRKRRCGRTPLP